MRVHSLHSRRGFTAVEIAMVATVIAILALLILPIFRQRSEDARIAAVEDELQSLVKALLLVEADMPGGKFLPRLNDLDNRDFSSFPGEVTEDPLNADVEPPKVFWIYDGVLGRGLFEHLDLDPTLTPSYDTIIANWHGPYVAFKNTVFLKDLASFNNMIDDQGGPIYVFDDTLDSLDRDKYPVDPWGNPYILYGAEEQAYNVRALYSLGPDGIPGGIAPPNDPRDWRDALESGARLGTDYYFYF